MHINEMILLCRIVFGLQCLIVFWILSWDQEIDGTRAHGGVSYIVVSLYMYIQKLM